MDKLKNKIQQAKSKLDRPRQADEDHPANFRSYEDGQYLNVDIDTIQPNPDQPRQTFKEETLAELADSIKERGLLQPIVVRMDEERNVILIAGERRLRACKMAGLTKIPAIVKTGDPMELALIENIQREDLNPIEEAEALNKLITDHDYTQEMLSKKLRKAKSTISEVMSLNRLPQSIRDEVRRAELFPRRFLLEIAKQDTPEAMIKLFETAKQHNLKSEDIRRISRKSHREQKISSSIDLTKKFRSFCKYIETINVDEYQEEDKTSLLAELENVLEKIKKLKDRLCG